MTGAAMPLRHYAEPPFGAADAAARHWAGLRGEPLACIAVGASTGGVAALTAFLTALPATVDVPILITQHLPAPFVPGLADQLSAIAGRRARVAADGMSLVPGELMMAPGDAHLTVARTYGMAHARLRGGPTPRGACSSIDPMFASIGKIFGGGAVGVVLSGMGRDGLIGARALAEAGGAVLAQDAASSVVWGMPGAVVASGLAEAPMPPAALAAWIGRWSAQAGDGLWT